jgi:two-component system, LytTR family, response regulator
MSAGLVVSALVVEDEEPARRTLREYLKDVEWIEVAGEARHGREAVRLIDRLEPGLVFLDVQLPELSGLEVLKRIRHAPEIVFTTAYDRYALAAFELGALDYLVKPFGRERLARALERVRTRLAAPGAGPGAMERARTALDARPLRRLFARSGDRIVPVPVDGITRVQAQGDYAEVHAPGGPYLLQVTLTELSARLDPERFLQVHRAHIVNLDAVRVMRPFDERRLLLVMGDGAEVVASRSASERLRALAR